MSKIKVFYDEKCLLHSPSYEILSGHITEWFESPDRVKNIKSHLEKFPDPFPITTSIKDFGMDPILAIHDRDYVEYLQTIFEQWVKEGGNPNAGVVPEMMLHKNLLPENFRADMKHSIGKVGMYHFDLSSTVTAYTWTSAYAAVQTALSAAEATLKSTAADTTAMFALIRPPGHHATTNLCGGYCYLNNVIICASYSLRQNPQLKCVIIDVDFHHGNGVEEILQRKPTEPTDNWRPRCRYISLHAHPEYPYYTTHLPTPLPKTVTAEKYLSLLREGLDGVKKWCGNEVLVLVSLGLDTLSGDPIGGFDGFANVEEYIGIGKEIGDFSLAINAKTCFLLEGGYVVSKLGVCIENVFRGFINATTNPN